MRKVPFMLTALGLLLGTLALGGHARAPKKDPVEALMEKKLAASQKVLAALALADFEKIAKHGDALILLSKRAEWKVIKTPLYEVYSNDFRGNARDLVKAARKKNVDGAALAYVEMTLTCVKCHKHVREKRMARAD
jgi:hypothetical protein